jgi:hypothetical protein
VLRHPHRPREREGAIIRENAGVKLADLVENLAAASTDPSGSITPP